MRLGTRTTVTVVVVAIAVGALLAGIWSRGAGGGFVEYALPLKEVHRLFDVGIVDANDDDLLDIYTSNHHFRQSLLLADGKGGYGDVVSDWRLDQSREFPRAELSFTAPEADKAGVYVYWFGTNLVILAHRGREIGPWRGSLQVYDPVQVVKNEGFKVATKENKGVVTETRVEFAADADGMLVLKPGGQGLPIAFELGGAIAPEQIYVGLGKVSPRRHAFVLAMQDRHGMAWADYNGDGFMDVFVSRGALSGMLNAYPESVQRVIRDELLLGDGRGGFSDVTIEAGIVKGGCSGRHVHWVDLDHDGLLDLYINCYDRENFAGTYPKQLYRQAPRGRLRNIATELGLDMPDHQIGGFAWLDVDDDGDVDFMTFENEGIFLMRNQGGRFVRESIVERTSTEAERIGRGTGARSFFDGKLVVSDYDADGDPDVFSGSNRGNLLLRNDKGNFSSVDLASVGLPDKSTTAAWVDYDNDGLPDLHLVPQGLFRQRKDHSFARTGLLEFPDEQYQAAILNWFDVDNDGGRDVLLALNENPSFRRWWEFSKPPRRASTWILQSFRNVGATNHWLQLRLVGGPGNRQGIGARVTIVTPDGEQTQEVGDSDGAFFSQGHYRLYYGLGKHAKADAIRIRWPDGHRQELKDAAADRLLVVEREKSAS